MSDDVNVWEPRDAVATISTSQSVVKQTFTALEGQQLFNLSAFAYELGQNSLLVYKNGALLSQGVDYSEVSETSFNITSAATAGDIIDVIGFIGAINQLSNFYYLGPKAVAPTTDNYGVTLDSTYEGYSYWNTATNNYWIWDGAAWQLQAASVATTASSVSIADAGNFYVGTNVETALQNIGSTNNNEGASIVGVEDAAANFTATDVEGVLAEIISTLASTANGKGASTIGVEDSGGNFAATDVEGVLAEIYAAITSGNRVLIETIEAAATANIDFLTGIDSTYKSYELEITGAVPVSDTQFYARVFVGGVIQTGATDYLIGGAATNTFGLGASNVISTASYGGFCAKLKFFAPSNTALSTSFIWDSIANYNTSSIRMSSGGRYDTANAVNGVRIYSGAATITSGTFKLYGIK